MFEEERKIFSFWNGTKNENKKKTFFFCKNLKNLQYKKTKTQIIFLCKYFGKEKK